MDRLAIVKEHVRFENAHDLDGIMGTFGAVACYVGPEAQAPEAAELGSGPAGLGGRVFSEGSLVGERLAHHQTRGAHRW